MPEALADQISAYRELLPQIREKYGLVWALITDRRLVRTFAEFSSAAEYASKHFPGRQVLIRHTSEVRETAPFIFVDEEISPSAD